MNDISSNYSRKRKSRGKRDHTPSRYRAIIREAKEGKQGRKIYSLVREARNLNDPYYASLALLILSRDRRLGSEAACSAAENALKLCSRVERGWRRAELLIELTRRVVDWRQGSADPETGTFRRYLFDRLLEQVEAMLPGKGLSDAVKGMTPILPPYLHEAMLGQALRDKGSVVDDARVVIRVMISGMSKTGSDDGSTISHQSVIPSTHPDTISTIVESLASISDLITRVKLLGYLHLQIRKSLPDQQSIILHDAITIADSISDEQQRLEILRYLSTIAQKRDEFNSLTQSVDQFQDKASGIRLATTMAGNADKAGQRELAVSLLLKALARTRDIQDYRERAVLFSNIALGLSRCGRPEDTNEAFHLSLESCILIPEMPSRSGIAERIRKYLKSLEIPEEGKIGELLHQILDRPDAEMSVQDRTIGSGSGVMNVDPRGIEGNDVSDGIESANEEEGVVSGRVGRAGSDEEQIVSGRVGKAGSEAEQIVSGRVGKAGSEAERIVSGKVGKAGNEAERIVKGRAGMEGRVAEQIVSGRVGMMMGEERDRVTGSRKRSHRNHILALYDAYEGAMKPVHFRAIARAAPLCAAFDLDLALMGFPEDDLALIIDQTITETNIGKGGRLLRELALSGRILLIPATRSGSDWDTAKHGMPIGTTSHPDPARSMTMAGLQRKIANHEIDSPLCLVMGLGRRGLPASLLSSFPYHLELTGKKIPLETCTVMGVIAERLRSISE